jgi:nickel superoxide dismutase
MKLFESLRRVSAFLRAPAVVHAHCDIPCGIYDPHAAQIAALGVVRMNQLIQELPKLSATSTPAERETYVHQISRYAKVKEEQAEICKHEIRIIWGDYFTPDHVKQFPDIHATAWDVMKLASKSRQEAGLEHAEKLLAKVQHFAELFWQTKGVKTKKQPSNQKSKGDLVYPTA